jgi:hypothetical protein|eukprot:Tamp_22016.p2 GENE.Tamp_22016~~Tamp_22016.p2  ORF type:complete len:104 (-),score=8.34 Tamp_22016:434-745(-)
MLCEPLEAVFPLLKEENIGLSYDKASLSIALLAPIVKAAVNERPIFEVALHLKEESDTQSVISHVVPSRLAACVSLLSPKRLPTMVITRVAAAGRFAVAFSLW